MTILYIYDIIFKAAGYNMLVIILIGKISMDQLVTRKEAAQILGVSVATLDIARSNGNLPYVQYVKNGKVFLKVIELQKYLDKNTHDINDIQKPLSYTYRKKRNK